MSNEGFKDRRRRLSSSSDEDFIKLSDGISYKDQETYKSEEEKKPEKLEMKKKPSNFQYQKPRRGKGRGANNNNWRREDKPKPKNSEKPQTHYRKKIVPKYDLNAQEFQPSGFNANASDFVSSSQVPSGFNPSAQEFNPQFGVDAPEFKPGFH